MSEQSSGSANDVSFYNNNFSIELIACLVVSLKQDNVDICK